MVWQRPQIGSSIAATANTPARGKKEAPFSTNGDLQDSPDLRFEEGKQTRGAPLTN
jgi:hypothetical protein